jgi:hypothetical protein
MAKRNTKTFFEQVPIESIKKIVDPKNAVEKATGSRKRKLEKLTSGAARDAN